MKIKEDLMSRQKIFAHKARIEKWLKDGTSQPITAEIDPTNICNYNCYDCAGGRLEHISRLTYEALKKIIDKISPIVKGIVFTGGGEPLTNPNTISGIVYAHKKGIDTGLITNGFYLNDKTNQDLTNTILNNSQWVRISLDAFDAEQYSLRKRIPPSYFNIVLENINQLVQKKQEINSKCTIGLAYLTQDENFEDLEKFVLLSKKIGVDYAQFRPYHHANKNLTEEIEKTKIHETNAFKVYYPKDKFKQNKIEFNYQKSFGDEFRIVISSTGDMYPDCFSRGNPTLIYGNILQQSFEEIWSSEKKQEIFNKKLTEPNTHPMSRTDMLNQILWELYQRPHKYDLDKLELESQNIEHKNFV